MPSDATSVASESVSDERRRTDYKPNDTSPTAVALTNEQSISRLFERQARSFPTRAAVVGAEVTLSYADLNAWANRCARDLLAHRAPASDVVAILLPKDVALFAAILGALKSGKAYVVLDSSHPDQRLADLVDDAGAGTQIITDRTLEPVARRFTGLAAFNHEVLLIDEDAVSAHSPADLDSSPAPDALSYLIYTSGSTGRPKAVMQTHRNVLSNVARHVNALRVTSDDRLTLIASPTTAQAATDIYCSFLTGATLYPVALRDVGFVHLAKWLRRNEITIFHSSASIFRSLLDALNETDCFPQVRIVKLGSEQVYRRDLERWRQHFSNHCVFVNALSSSEAGVVRQMHIAHAADIDTGTVVPVGYPVADVEVSLLDADGNPVPAGEPGEIVLRGEYLTPGYWNRPDLTRAALRADPGGGPARSFATGDHGRLLPDGRLVYLGRSDDQVKIRGFRVEKAEVEAAIVDQPAVSQAVVRVQRDDAGRISLAGYVVLREGMQVTTRDLSRSLRARLPAHMIPSALMIMDSLPLTSSGKVDVQALPPVKRTPPSGATVQAIQPRTQLETQLTAIWEELLDVRPISMQDDFFDLGGHSLLAIQMMDRAEKVTGLRVPLSTLLRGATIEQLAAEMLRSDPSPLDASLVELRHGTGRQPFIFLHGEFNGGGNYCRGLAARLAPDRSFAVIPPHGHDDDKIPTTIEAMAADRLRVLLAYQPQGPYLLGGYCNGGLVAFEMARQLKRRGASVDLLVLVDARALNVRFAWLQWLVTWIGRIIGLDDEARARTFSKLRSLAIELHTDPRAFGKKFVRRAEHSAEHPRTTAISGSPSRRIGGAALRADDGRPIEAIYDEAFRLYGEVINRYVPVRYEGRVVLFHSRTMTRRSPRDPTAGWRRVVANLELHHIAGEHHTCVTDHLDDLATQLSEVLSRVDGPQPAFLET